MSKITVPTITWIELYARLAAWHVEETALDYPWKVDDEGNLSYTDDAQDKFNDASDRIQEILSIHFKREEI